MDFLKRLGAVVAVTAGLLAAGGAPALAADTTGRDYAEHVRMCQQMMGFSGTHNPGVMHHGYSGWDPEHAC